MVQVPLPKEKWTGQIAEVEIGGSAEHGGSRRAMTIGGKWDMPFLRFEGQGHGRTAMAGLVMDSLEDAPPTVIDIFDGKINDPALWASAWVNDHGADMICLRLTSTNPEESNVSAEDAAQTVKRVLDAVDVPLFVYGSGHEEKGAKVMEKVGERARGERLLLGQAEEGMYKSIAAAAMANDHSVIGFSNLDINLAKQIVILLTDFGVKLDRIVIDPLMASLGMGLEYSYSVNERIRLAGLSGDRMLQIPMICDCSSAWKSREATDEIPYAGDTKIRGAWWEATTALAAMLSGADVLVLAHPEAMRLARMADADLRGDY